MLIIYGAYILKVSTGDGSLALQVLEVGPNLGGGEKPMPGHIMLLKGGLGVEDGYRACLGA